jgi:hypothetical protein
VRFPGALGEFQSTFPLPPGASNKSTWSDAAFIGPGGDDSNPDVRLVRVEFSTKTIWIDDGSHRCSHISSKAPSMTAASTLAQPVLEPTTTAKPSSLLVPETGNGLSRIPAFPQTQRITLSAATIVPVEIESYKLKALLPLNPVEAAPIAGLIFTPLCPITAGYLDLGGGGRLYTALLNQSNKTMKTAEFTIRTGGLRQALNRTTTLAPGKSIAATWQTTPALTWAEPTFLQLDRVVYSDSSVWADAGHGACVTAARPDVNSMPASESSAPPNDLPVIVTGVVPFAPSVSPIAEAKQLPKEAKQLPKEAKQPPKLAKPVVAPPARPTSVPVPDAHATPTPEVTPTRAVAIHEDASPESFRENVPLIKLGKASLCTITTSPTGGEVKLDGKRLGTAPLVFVMVRTGQPRELDITLSGYNPVHSTYTPDGKTFPLDVHFVPLAP